MSVDRSNVAAPSSAVASSFIVASSPSVTGGSLIGLTVIVIVDGLESDSPSSVA